MMYRRAPTFSLLFIVALLLVGPGTPVWAQTPQWQTSKAPAKKIQADLLTPDWNIKCSSVPATNGFNCQMTRAIVLKNTRQLLLKMTVRLPAQTKKPVMLLQLPHGLFLPAGITLRIDKNTSQTQVVQTCDKKGCYAGMPIASGMLAALKKGQQLNVSFQNLKKAPTTVPVPLDGFTKAYEQMIQR